MKQCINVEILIEEAESGTELFRHYSFPLGFVLDEFDRKQQVHVQTWITLLDTTCNIHVYM